MYTHTHTLIKLTHTFLSRLRTYSSAHAHVQANVHTCMLMHTLTPMLTLSRWSIFFVLILSFCMRTRRWISVCSPAWCWWHQTALLMWQSWQVAMTWRRNGHVPLCTVVRPTGTLWDRCVPNIFQTGRIKYIASFACVHMLFVLLKRIYLHPAAAIPCVCLCTCAFTCVQLQCHFWGDFSCFMC